MRTVFATLLLLSLAVAVAAQDFEAGQKAYRLGDYPTAFNQWRALAERGEPEAQLRLGLLYDDGYGVARDQAAALKWYRLAAVQGMAEAENNLAVMHYLGQGMARDNVRAHMWFSLMAAQGNAAAKRTLGMVAESMTPDELAESRRLAAAWTKQHG